MLREPLILPAIAFRGRNMVFRRSAVGDCSVPCPFRSEQPSVRQICLLGAAFCVGGSFRFLSLLKSNRNSTPHPARSSCFRVALSDLFLRTASRPGSRSNSSRCACPRNSDGAAWRVLPQLEYGQRVEVEAKVRKPKNFGNPGAFDFVGYLRRQSVYWLASAWGTNKIDSSSRNLWFEPEAIRPATESLGRRTRTASFA